MEKVIDPVSVRLLKSELTPERKLCNTNKGGNEIYVVDGRECPHVLTEVGRLRERAFRSSGGGTGRSVDLDEFDTLPDKPYMQLIIWDPDASAILGGYRFILGPDVRIQEDGQPYMTSSHLFRYSERFVRDYLPHVMELGRSFVTPEYQSSKAGAKGIFALDNLWDGIAAVILQHPNIMYFLGKMTIYPEYDKTCRELIQHFLFKHFPDPDGLAWPVVPLKPLSDGRLMDLILRDEEFKPDYRNLKDAIRRLGSHIPPLVNSYMNVSPSMKVFGCSVNDEFFDAYETGIMVCFEEIYEEKRDRHKMPYYEHLARLMRKRVPQMRKTEVDLVQALDNKKKDERIKRFNDFLDRQKMSVAEAEKRLRRKVQSRTGKNAKNKKEKVEP